MSDMYAVKASTLTAIGDAIRGKQGRTNMSVEGIRLMYGQNDYIFTSDIFAPQYKYVVNIHDVIYDYGRNLCINKTNAQGELLYYLKPVKEDCVITVETDVSTIYIELEATTPSRTDACTVDIAVIPLDENGNEYKYIPLEMAEQINGLNTIPDTALTLTGQCNYKFAYNTWNWFIENYGDKIITEDITNTSYMFYNSNQLTNIPFDINLSKSVISLEQMFYGCQNLEEIPNVFLAETPTSTVVVKTIFSQCKKIKEIPEWLIELCEHNFNTALSTGKWSDFGPFGQLFSLCASIRKIPERLMTVLYNPVATGDYYTLIYSNPFDNMHALEELINIPVEDLVLTSNKFSSWFSSLCRLSRLTMVTNEDGSPVMRQWKNQTWDLTRNIGYGNVQSPYFTDDKKVSDDATYQALKNDPDWWAMNINYSRYNHDSAVETINSLPDTSAYGTNIIKFRGPAGALTDGGAINTLTEEEIAVATAKGWTVTLA